MTRYFDSRSAGRIRTAIYRVQPESLDKCLAAIREFVEAVRTEPGTRLYVSLQDKNEPTHFVHVMIFEDTFAEERHRTSEATKRFVRSLYPELVDPVVITDFDVVAST